MGRKQDGGRGIGLSSVNDDPGGRTQAAHWCLDDDPSR